MILTHGQMIFFAKDAQVTMRLRDTLRRLIDIIIGIVMFRALTLKVILQLQEWDTMFVDWIANKIVYQNFLTSSNISFCHDIRPACIIRFCYICRFSTCMIRPR